MTRLIRGLRSHLHFAIVATIVIIVTTYPTIQYVFDTENFWLPTKVYDVWTNLWNAWYGELLLAGQAEILHTDLMFFPQGVSLSFHSFSLPHMFLLSALKLLMPVSNAFNLTYLLIIFVTTLSAYIYLLYLLRDRWISLFGAIMFGCSIYVIARPSQPIVTTIATIPLSLYFFHRAVQERRWYFTVVSGLLIGLTAFIGIYTYICLIIALGMYILYFALLRWRHPVFWLRILFLLLIAGAIGLIRVYPMMRDSVEFEQALTKQDGREYHTDLIHYFVNFHHPNLTPIFRQLFGLTINPRWNTSYIGYFPLLLIAYGLIKARYRRKMLFWLFLLAPFVLLRLGSVLTVNGEQFQNLILPKELLDQLLPSIFAAIYSPDYFHSGALLPLAVLACYGLMTLLRSIASRYRKPIIALLIAVVAFEYHVSLDQLVIPDQQVAFLDWLENEAEADSIRLVNLPMGRVNAKLYDFFQTLSGYPHAEGIAGRTPPAAYDYIRANFVLSAWNQGRSIRCLLLNQDEYLAALDSLARDGFTHVVYHRFLWNSSDVLDSFVYADPSFHNDYTSVFRICRPAPKLP